MSIKKNIPNLLTLGNVICGCLGILSLFQGNYFMVFWLMFIAGWLDLGDGLVARLLNVKSELGKELDSLADMLSFGALPGFIYYTLIKETLGDNWEYLPYFGFIVAAASAFRLAKFNIDTRQTENFIGVPTPANAAFSVGLLMVWHTDTLGLAAYFSPWLLIGLAILCSYLLNSEWELFSFKMKNFKWKGNEVRYLYLIITLGLMPFIGWATFVFGFFLYLIFSIINFRNI
jgi:CDP-diacylglycerol--serine O-phosphatidyltransferase